MLLSLMLAGSLWAQEKGVPFNGVLYNTDGAPVKNVKIYVKSPNAYATTDKQGRFGLTDVQADDTLHFRIKKQNYAIPVEGRKSIKVRLAFSSEYEAEESKDLIDQGYGYVKRREFTGAATRLSGEDFRRAGYTSLTRALVGRVPGLRISANGALSIRGENSINSGTDPLILVDGNEVPDLESVSITDIDYVEVLKDSNMYGVRGSAGVILITTLKANVKR